MVPADSVTNFADGLFSVVGMTESELVARARAGDADAWRTLVDGSYDACWRYALRVLRNAADAEDAVQETFLRALGALSRYREQQQFRAWLFTILVNQCRNALVAQGRRARRFVETGDWPADDARLGVTNPTPLGDDGLARAVSALDEQSREAVLLRFGEGMEYSEIADVTGASLSAVKMRVSRALTRLRLTLGTENR